MICNERLIDIREEWRIAEANQCHICLFIFYFIYLCIVLKYTMGQDDVEEMDTMENSDLSGGFYAAYDAKEILGKYESDRLIECSDVNFD